MGKSTLRIGVTLCAVAIGFVALIDEAAAQYYPPPYDGYRAPPRPGYRPAPMPDDDDDDMDGPPGVFSRPPGAIPNGPNSARPYPYGSQQQPYQQQPYASRGFDPRYGTYSGNQDIESSP